MKGLKAAKKILGIKIHINSREEKLFLFQQKYILGRFDKLDAKSVKTPLTALFQLSVNLSPQTDEEEKNISRIPNTNAIESIMYDMVCTHLGISHSVMVVSRYC